MRSPATKTDTRVAGTIRIRSSCFVGADLVSEAVGAMAEEIAVVEVRGLLTRNFCQ